MTSPPTDRQYLEDEVAELEKRLRDAKARLNQRDGGSANVPSESNAGSRTLYIFEAHLTATQRSMHCFSCPTLRFPSDPLLSAAV